MATASTQLNKLNDLKIKWYDLYDKQSNMDTLKHNDKVIQMETLKEMSIVSDEIEKIEKELGIK